MAPLWEPGTQYNYGDVVVYEDVLYKIIQPHRSQGDWTPPVTPALWGRLQGGGGDHHHREEQEQWGADCKPLPGDQQFSHGQEVIEKVTYQDSSYQTSYQSPAAPPPQEHKEKHWYEEHKKELEIGAGVAGLAAVGAGIYAHKQHGKEVSHQAPAEPPPQEKHWYDEHKKELIGAGAIAAIGGGILAYKQHENKVEEESYQAAPVSPPQEKHWYDEHKKELIGAGAIAAVGAGILAYKQHEKKEEEQQAKAWSASHWMQDAQMRTQQWRAGQCNASVAWIWNEGKSIPRDAIQGGEERGEVLYICRAYHESGLLIGKASRVFKKGAVIGFKKEEIHIDKYEILVGDARAVRWVSCSGQLNIESLRARPIEGGREPDGTPIYIAQAPHHGAVHPGKACESYGDGCFIPYDNSEKKVKEYAVLCSA